MTEQGWFRLDNAAVDVLLPRVGLAAFGVYVCLVRRAGQAGRCWPSVKRIMADTRLSKRMVFYHLNTLKAVGAITTEKRPGSSTLYTILSLSGGAIDCTASPSGGATDCTDPCNPLHPTPATDCTQKKTKGRTNKKKTPGAPEEQSVLTSWNEAARRAGFHEAREVTDKRKTALHARLASPDWRLNWQAAITRIERSSFCRGGGPRGWKADFDWFLRPDTLTRILEGKYDDANSNGRNGHTRNGSPARPHERDYSHRDHE